MRLQLVSDGAAKKRLCRNVEGVGGTWQSAVEWRGGLGVLGGGC